MWRRSGEERERGIQIYTKPHELYIWSQGTPERYDSRQKQCNLNVKRTREYVWARINREWIYIGMCIWAGVCVGLSLLWHSNATVKSKLSSFILSPPRVNADASSSKMNEQWLRRNKERDKSMPNSQYSPRVARAVFSDRHDDRD